jgi:hypothetical protein
VPHLMLIQPGQALAGLEGLLHRPAPTGAPGVRAGADPAEVAGRSL